MQTEEHREPISLPLCGLTLIPCDPEGDGLTCWSHFESSGPVSNGGPLRWTTAKQVPGGTWIVSRTTCIGRACSLTLGKAAIVGQGRTPEEAEAKMFQAIGAI